MSKSSRNKARSARERIAAQQAAARRAEQRRRLLIAGGSVIVVIAVVIVLAVVKLSSGTAKQAGTGPLPASVQKQVTTVPARTLAAVGGGSVASSPPPLTRISGPPLTSGGKPEMLYIGAEWCPLCAAMRWSMAVALSRFGTFGPLKGIHSSSTDAYPNTATLTFLHAQFHSRYLTFTAVENQDVHRHTLQPTTKAQQALWQKYDTTNGQVGFPFIDFGNQLALKGPIYNPAVLKGLTWAQIAADLRNPASPVAQGADGAANNLTAAICKMTHDLPVTVCAAPPIPLLEGNI